jgi:hypothetical protein
MSDVVVDDVLDSLAGASAGSILPDPMYLDLLTTAPSDDNGTGAVSWGQGRASVATVDATNWPAAAGRAKAGAAFALPVNTSGALITVVAGAWYDAPTGGTYLGGGPVPGDSLDIPAGAAPVLTPTLASPSPS